MALLHQDALELLEADDLLELGMEADATRQSLWPERVVTYTVGYTLSLGATHDWQQEAESALARGARSLILRTTPGIPLDHLLSHVRQISKTFPAAVLTGPSATEVAALSPEKIRDAMHALRDAGLSALDAGPRPHVDTDLSTNADIAAWQTAHRAAHEAGLPSTAAITLRSTDTPRQWLTLLDAVDAVQQETHGFLACRPRIESMDRALDEVTGAVYLKVVAFARLYLAQVPDAVVPHIQTDWSIFGPKVLQLALRFGADDAGLIEPTPRDPRNPSHHSGEEELRRILRDAGYQPVERDPLYRVHYLS